MRTCLIAVATLVVCSSLSAQSFPSPPQPANHSSTDEITREFANDAVKTRVGDASFWGWNAPALAMSGTDLALTAQCLAAKTCVEQNPLLGAYPSMPRLFGTSLPLIAAELGFSYYMKKSRHPWRVFPALNTATHAIAIGMSLAAR